MRRTFIQILNNIKVEEKNSHKEVKLENDTDAKF